MCSAPPACFRNAHRRANRRDEQSGALAGLTLVLAVLGIAALPGDLAAQAPSAPTAVQVLSEGDVPPFAGTTVFVSTSGADTNAGTQSSPVRTIQRGVLLANQANAAGQPSRVFIAAGIYREAVDLGSQKTDAALVVEGTGPSTVLTGTDDWTTGWSARADGSYVHAWPYAWGMKPIPNGWDWYWNWDGNGYKRDILRRSETVYVNGNPLRGVLTLAELSAVGTFYVDETGGRLYARFPAGTTLADSTIEVGIRITPLRINVRRNVTLKTFAVIGSRGAVQDTAVNITNSQNITLDGVEIRETAYTALGTALNTGVHVTGSALSDNGVNGYVGYRDKNVLLEDSEIARNNWRGWPAEHKGWDSVFKWGQYRDAVVQRTRFTDNYGHGFWLDYDNQRVSLTNSLLSGNKLQGVNLEANQGPITLTGNRICNNVEAGIGDSRSNFVTLQDNSIFGNAQHTILFTGDYSGRSVTDYQSGTTSLVRSQYWSVTGNVISASQGDIWAYTDSASWSLVRDTLRAMDNNNWYQSSSTNPFWLPQGKIAYSPFRTDIQRASAVFEVNSRWQAPSLPSCTMP